MWDDQTFCRSLEDGVGRDIVGRKGKSIFQSINFGKYKSLPFLRWKESNVIDLLPTGLQFFLRWGHVKGSELVSDPRW